MVRIRGTKNKDKIGGTGSRDFLYGLSGHDVLIGRGGNDRLFGGRGKDKLKGKNGNDKLKGGSGNDKLYGDAGHDLLSGGRGHDQLFGGSGNDTISGGRGFDTAYFSGVSTQYSFQWLGGAIQLSGPDGIDIVFTDVEVLQFADRAIHMGFNYTPAAGSDANGTSENGVVFGPSVLANDSDLDVTLGRQGLTVSQVNGGPVGVPVALPSGAVVVMQANGTYVYNTNNAFEFLAQGQAAFDTFTYQVSDGAGGFAIATVTIRIVGTNDGPVANPDTASATENGAVVPLDVLANDTDIDSDDDASSLKIVAASAASGAGVVFSGAAGAGISYDPDGVAAFESLAAGETTTDTITYTIEDSHGASSSSTVTVTITGTNDGPVANADTASAMENGAVVPIDALANDTDIDSDDDAGTLKVIAASAASGAGVVFSGAAGAGITYDPDGVAAFESLAAGETTTDTITYTIEDSHGASSTSTVTVTITGTNDGPVANADTASAMENGAVVPIDVLANDTDIDSDDDAGTLKVIAASAASGAGVVFSGAAGAGITYDPDGVAAFESLAAGETTTDTITYTIEDSHGASSTSTVTVTITGTNDGPVANADTASAMENGAVVPIDVLANDTDIDSDDDAGTLKVIAASAASGAIIGYSGAAGAGISYDPDGVAAFESLAAGETTTDTITYTIEDSHGAQSTSTVTVTITGTNDVPVITGDTSGGVTEDGTLTASGTLTVTDTDTGESLTQEQTGTLGSYGTFAVTTAGVWTYTPDNGNAAVQALPAAETLTEIFTVTSADGTASEDVTVTITGKNDVPAITGDTSGGVTEDGTLTASGTLTVTDTDTGESFIQEQTGTLGSYGTFAVTTAGVWTYTPDNGNAAVQALPAAETLTEIFTVTSADGTASEDVTVTITGKNDVPVITGDTSGGVTEDGTLTASGTLTVTDTDTGESFTQEQTGTLGSYGTFAVTTAGVWTYTLDNGNAAVQALPAAETLTEIFTVTSADGTASEDVTVTITGTNDAPVIEGAKTLIVPSGSQTIDLNISRPSDVDNESLTITITSVPQVGEVRLGSAFGGGTVQSGDEVTPEQLESLIFTPPPNGQFSGEALTYSVSDGAGAPVSGSIVVEVLAQTVLRQGLYFRADDGTAGAELFKLDSSGTVTRVADINPGAGSSEPAAFTEFSGSLYFRANDGTSGVELYKLGSGGTVTRVADINPGAGNSTPWDFTEFGGSLYFSAYDSTSGVELYMLDAGGAMARVADINPGAGTSGPDAFTEFGGSLYFRANDGSSGMELYKLDTEGTVTRVADINPGAGNSAPYGFTEFGGSLYFRANDGTSGMELYKLDTGGTVTRVADINPGGDSSPNFLTEFDDALYFAANDGSSGIELYKLESGGTVTRVADINPGAGHSSPTEFTEFGGSLYFRANDGSSGAELYVLDPGGEVTRVADIYPNAFGSSPDDFTEFDGALYFSAVGVGVGIELYKLDSAGTVTRVADINPEGSSSPNFLTEFGGSLYFAAIDGTSGIELYKLDSAGTVTRVADINPGVAHSTPSNLTVFDNAESQDLVVTGGSGDDILAGGIGNDTLTGNGGADSFYFAASLGQDTITDFQVGVDTLVFSSAVFASQALALAAATGSTDAVITDGAGNTVTLTDVDTTNLTEDDFAIV